MKENIVEKIIFIICGLLVLGLAGSIDYDEELARDEHYCFMVEMFKQSNGESGWPDFNNNYDEVCE